MFRPGGVDKLDKVCPRYRVELVAQSSVKNLTPPRVETYLPNHASTVTAYAPVHEAN